MARYLFDTNIVIYIRRKRPPALLQRFERMERDAAALSVITYGELRYGAEKSAERERALAALDELTALIPVLPLPDGVGEAYGAIRARLKEKGRVIGNNDLWIAAHAVSAGLTLVTSNEREFKRVPGLKSENWVV